MAKNDSNCNIAQNNAMEDSYILKTNQYLKGMNSDYLYHLNIGTDSHNLQQLFADVKFVCMGGTPNRMEDFAKYIQKELGYSTIKDYSSKRFAFFKIGPILSVSHGMGMPSFSILLHEMIKLMHYAKCQDPIFIRIGTCGGVGVKPGTVVVTKNAYNGLIKNVHEFIILGKRVERDAKFDENLANEIISCGNSNDNFDTILANTMATDDFYEGQGRVDGAVCFHTENEKMKFLEELYKKGIRNIEMEATVFAALTRITGIKAADICVTLINRLEGDQVTTPKEKLIEMESRPQQIVGRFIKKKLSQ